MPIAKLRWGYPPPVFVTKQIAVPQVSPENESGAWAKSRFSEKMTDMATIFYVKE
jgi:hypothetical protein